MALLDTYLKEIQICSSTISELSFPPPKIFTNALLNTRDITALIRDTEAHERALFSVAPADETTLAREAGRSSARRTTVFEPNRELKSKDGLKGPRRNTAVAAVLGGDVADRLRRERMGERRGSRLENAKSRDNLDVEFLLKGAESLCNVYPIPGALDRISTLRNRYRKMMSSIEHYEALVAEQGAQLRQMNRPTSSISFDDDDDDDEDDKKNEIHARHEEKVSEAPLMTEDDLRREEESVRELERRKQTLEERVSGMEKDLGGILR